MLEHSKLTRICLIEYFIAMFVHVMYSFVVMDENTSREVLLFSLIMIFINCVTASVSKNKYVNVYILIFSLVFSFSILGIMLNTLAYLVFTLSMGIIFLAIFLEPTYILSAGILSLVALLTNGLVFKDNILLNFPSIKLYYFFVILFVFAIINLYYVLRATKNYYLSMKEKTSEAEHAIDSKEFFLNNMSHEIRSPMNSICGLAELTLREDLSPSVRDNLENIQASSKVLISIVNDILDYTKMESGEMDIIPVTYSYRSMVNDVIDMMKVKTLDKSIEIRSEVQPDLPDTLIGDEIRVRQILFNLVSNAVKYTERGYVIIESKGTSEGGFLDLTVSVTDTGIGIRKDDLSKLFTIFQKVDTRSHRNKDGSGLGLAICKQLLNMMGGTISVESTFGVGSKFVFTLSQKISTHNIVEMHNNNVDDLERVKSTNGKVLVVDDNLVNLKVAEGLLKTFGLTVDVAKSGRQCLEILETTYDYDIIFIDHMMPELDGIDTLKLIRNKEAEYFKKVPLIALTANVVNGIRDMLISQGFDEYIAKPIDMIWLNSLLRKYLPKDKQQ